MDEEKKYQGFITGEKKEGSFWEIKDKSSSQKKSKVNSKQYPPFVFLIVMVFIAVCLLGLFFIYATPQKLLFKPLEKTNNTSNIVQPSLAPSPTSNLKTSSIRKEEIKIKVLNGSGVKGQAAKMKDLLEKLGFKDIEIGSADDPQEVTEVKFGSEISGDIKKEIRELLEKNYLNVSEKDNENLNFNIYIMTGKLR